MPINCDYWRRGATLVNFGEALIPLLLHGFGHRLGHGDDRVLCSIGSELDAETAAARERSFRGVTFWGTGYANKTPVDPRRHDIRAVRGPWTRRVLGLPDDFPTGEPGLLLRQLHPLGEPPRDGGVLFAPHWRNRPPAPAWRRYEFFDVGVRPVEIAAQLARLHRAEFVLTSAMHVAVACLAYGVPFAPALGPGETFDKPWKWADLSALIGAPLPWCADEPQGRLWWRCWGVHIELPDLTPLIDAFPHDLAYSAGAGQSA